MNYYKPNNTLVVVYVYTLIFIATDCFAGVMHSHIHQINHLPQKTKEREEDGAYSPRVRAHVNKESAEHDSEIDHEAILGSSKVAEEFDHLSEEESVRRLRILLKNMDLNADQFIDRIELTAWILKSFKSLSEEEAQERFSDADENEDGKITWEEYMNDVYGDDNEGFSEESKNSIREDNAMWKTADLNGDGALNLKEWIPFAHPEEHSEMLPHILEQTLLEKDTNKDGHIDFQEFVGDRAQEHDKEWIILEKNKFDEDYDKDGDGVLNSSEILSWIVPSNEDIAREEVTHLFDASDDDHDDLLSYDEIVAHHDIFVGSEATDYGEHIQNIHQFTDEL